MSETHIAINKVGIYLIFKMNVREANMMLRNNGILEQMEYLSIHIPKIKIKVLNIYPVIQYKPIPILFIS